MGKAKRLKEQRKIEREERKARKVRRKNLVIKGSLGFFLLLILISGAFLGTVYAKNKWFKGKKQTNSSELTVDKVKDKNNKYEKAPKMTINVNKKYVAKFETSRGNFEVELDAKNTPITVNNFVFLARDKFYDGLTFHRIIKDFMIQGGDPKGDGSGGPGYKFDDEKIIGDYTKGTLAMANSGANTNGSQFFIMTGDYSNGKLPKSYVIFGKVISGMDNVLKIAQTEVKDNGRGETSKPINPILINRVMIEER